MYWTIWLETIIFDDPNHKYLLDQVQDGYLSCWVWLGIQNKLMLKIIGISDDLTDILDELDTSLDDPYDRYLSWTWALIVSTI